MDPKLTHIFCNIEQEPRSDLCRDICHRVLLREKRYRQIKLFGYTIIGVISFAIIIPAGVGISKHLQTIIVSSDGIIAGYLRDVSLALVQSEHILETLALIFMIPLIAWAIRRSYQQIHRVRVIHVH